MTVHLEGYVASADGLPVLRVATLTEDGHAYADFSPAIPSQLPDLASDTFVYGNAWVNLDGRRVDPRVVVIEDLNTPNPPHFRHDPVPMADLEDVPVFWPIVAGLLAALWALYLMGDLGP